MAVSVAALVALFVSPASAAGSKYPPDATCQTNGVVRSIVYLGGVTYLGGDFTQVTPAGIALGGTGTVTRNYLAACSESTGAILPWNPGANGRVMSLANAGSTIYVGGHFTTLAGQSRKNIGAVTTTGAATSFNPTAAGEVFVVRVGPNGNIFAGGSFSKLAGKSAPKIGELTPAGARVSWPVTVGQVTGFACPPRCPPQVFTIAFSGSTVYFGGHFGLVNGVSRNEAAAVNISSGALLAWNPNIYASANCPTCQTVETSRVYTIIPDPVTHEIYICGGFWKVNGTKLDFNVGAYDPTTGALWPKFTIQDDGDTPGCALHAGVLYFGGHFNYVGPLCHHTTVAPCYVYHHVAAANVATNTLLAWNPGANSNHGIYTVGQDATHVGFGGYQTKFGGRLQGGYATYSSTLP
ncbi:MAG TPA: hypothetical protein VMU66_09430 [Gaiellales bacterium]|nr:hypothetical protein [Gaiellales bacterium]